MREEKEELVVRKAPTGFCQGLADTLAMRLTQPASLKVPYAAILK